MAALDFWSTHFPRRRPEHYVFPAERYGAAGDKFAAKTCGVDTSNPMRTSKRLGKPQLWAKMGTPSRAIV